ncbi:hypothetical protein [Actinokineospora sp. NBRC 105648]|uniref:hypothetical protein n=1 Tax=Actinokineospora sp. NBRC 105648 TaxID=3032206 RepID=UPI0024A1D1A1|nr:hypothetical protein [Actinokineospora sp. NBRC 105648]GLZ43303.1 hypothetical protein Acsp05_69270 [Actinokineospora sp. NBRC 105648]
MFNHRNLRVHASVSIGTCQVRYTVEDDEDVEVVVVDDDQEFGMVFTRAGLAALVRAGQAALTEMDALPPVR